MIEILVRNIPPSPDTSIGEVITWMGVLFGLLIAVGSAFTAYFKLVLEKGIIPPAEFNIHCKNVGNQAEMAILEIILHLKNLGTSVLVASNIRVDILYFDSSERSIRFHVDENKCGRLNFPCKLKDQIMASGKLSNECPEEISEEIPAEIQRPCREVPKRFIEKTRNEDKEKKICSRGFCVIGHNTFVNPGVDQIYTFVTSVPKNSTYVLIWSCFDYPAVSSFIQRVSLKAARKMGIISYTLDDIEKPHTCERVFRVGDEKPGSRGLIELCP
jgi:hypothetical protein